MTDEIIKTAGSDHASFYRSYIENVTPGSVTGIFSQDIQVRQNLFAVLSGSDDLSGYAPGKWSVKELLQHCIDTERIFSIRALMLARGETQEIPGFDEKPYAENSHGEKRKLESLRHEWGIVRQATVSLFESFEQEDFAKSGIVSGNKLTVRAVPYIIVGHALHHFQVLQSKYGFDF